MADVDIIARLKLAGDGFNTEFRREMGRVEGEAQKSANRLRSSFSAVKGAAVGLVAGFGIEGLARVVTNAVERIDELGDAAERLGVSAKFLQRFEYAAISMDSSVGAARDGLGKFNKVVGDYINGNKAAAKAIEETLGVQVEQNGKIKSSEQLLYDVSDAIAKLPTQYQKAAAVQKIFGRGAEELIPLLSSGSKVLRQYGDDFERAGGGISEVHIKRIGEMKKAWDQFANILQSKVADAVAENADGLKEAGDAVERLIVLLVKGVGLLGTLNKGFNQKSTDVAGWGRYVGDATGLSGIGPAVKDWIGYDDNRAARRTDVRGGSRSGNTSASGIQSTIRTGTGPLGMLRRNFLPEDDTGRAKPSILGSFAPICAAAQRLSTTVMEVRANWAAVSESSTEIGGKLGEMLTVMREQADIDMLRAQGLDDQADMIEDMRSLAAEVNSIEGLTTAERQAGLEALSQQLLVGRALVTATKQASDFAADFAENFGKGDMEAVVEGIDKQSDLRRDKFEEERDLQKQHVAEIADYYETLMTDGVGGVWRDFKRQGMRMVAEIAAQWTLAMLSGQKFSIGSVLGGMGSMGGGGGALSSVLSVGSSLAPSLLGSAGGIGASAAGLGGAIPGIGLGIGALALASTLIGGLKTKKGSATLGFVNGGLGVTSTSGNSKSRIAAASDGIGSVADTLTQIADALGGSLGGTASVSLGVRKKSYRVDTTGAGRTKGAGVLDFGTDQQAAIEAAIRDALQDGVVTGISQASKNILAAGGDIQKAVEKAVSIEQLPKLLKDRLDPVGAAVDAVNAKFTDLVATLKEAGASAEQIDQARQLYQLEKADALSTTGGSASLKSFLSSFASGSASPYSLRTQRSNAQSALDPFLAQIAAGSAIDVDKYLAAAQTFLDIERQIEGSRPGYFASLDRIQAATQQAISRIDGQSSVSTKDPFAELTAQATQATANLTEQSNLLLQQVIAQLGNLGNVMGGGAFIGTARGFVNAV